MSLFVFLLTKYNPISSPGFLGLAFGQHLGNFRKSSDSVQKSSKNRQKVVISMFT